MTRARSKVYFKSLHRTDNRGMFYLLLTIKEKEKNIDQQDFSCHQNAFLLLTII